MRILTTTFLALILITGGVSKVSADEVLDGNTVDTAGHIDHGKTTLTAAITSFNCYDEGVQIATGFPIHPGATSLDRPSRVEVQVALFNADGERISTFTVGIPTSGGFGVMDIKPKTNSCDGSSVELLFNGEDAGRAKVIMSQASLKLEYILSEDAPPAARDFVAAYLNDGRWSALSGTVSVIDLSTNHTDATYNIGGTSFSSPRAAFILQ